MYTPWHVRVANLVKESIPKFRDWHCWGWDTSHRLKIPRILLFANLHSVQAYIRKDWPWKNVPASYVVLAVLWKYGTYTCFVRTWWNGENLALNDRIILGHDHIKLHMPLFRYNIITLVQCTAKLHLLISQLLLLCMLQAPAATYARGGEFLPYMGTGLCPMGGVCLWVKMWGASPRGGNICLQQGG